MPSGAPVAGSAKLIQDVADLVVDGRTAEMVAERQIDNIEKQVNSLKRVHTYGRQPITKGLASLVKK